TDWRQFQFGPDHTGLNPYENVLSPSTVSGLQLGWSLAGGDFGQAPAVAGGRVFVGDDNTIYALRADTGALVWKHTIPYNGYIPCPALWHHRVFYGSNVGAV